MTTITHHGNRTTDATSALIVVDVQNDFLPGGALAVPRGDEVISVVNRLSRHFDVVVLTQDWHPSDHVSFATQHAGRAPFDTIELTYGRQVLWPDHCVQGTAGASLAAALDIPHARLIIRKGVQRHVDSYSAFVEADRHTTTGLTGYLTERGITSVVIAGLATDFCVGWTAIDATSAGFAAAVVDDACRAIDANGSLAAAWTAMANAGVQRIMSEALV